jgi:hypothetical protein
MARQEAPDAVKEGVARCKHAYRTATVGKHLSDCLVEGYRPRSRTASNQGRRQREVARAAEDDGSRLNQFPPGRTQALDTILADPDDGQPAV